MLSLLLKMFIVFHSRKSAFTKIDNSFMWKWSEMLQHINYHRMGIFDSYKSQLVLIFVHVLHFSAWRWKSNMQFSVVPISLKWKHKWKVSFVIISSTERVCVYFIRCCYGVVSIKITLKYKLCFICCHTWNTSTGFITYFQFKLTEWKFQYCYQKKFNIYCI